MSHILIVGFMGAGKSTVGRLVSDRLGIPFVDLDELVEETEGLTVAQIWSESGEAAFRAAESTVLASLTEAVPTVVACGGGVVLADGNRALLGSLGHVVYLTVSAEEALARVGGADSRPLLAGGGAVVAQQLLEARESLYRVVADAVVPTTGRAPDEVARDVVAVSEGWVL
jgi:shikimate kinase